MYKNILIAMLIITIQSDGELIINTQADFDNNGIGSQEETDIIQALRKYIPEAGFVDIVKDMPPNEYLVYKPLWEKLDEWSKNTYKLEKQKKIKAVGNDIIKVSLTPAGKEICKVKRSVLYPDSTKPVEQSQKPIPPQTSTMSANSKPITPIQSFQPNPPIHTQASRTNDIAISPQLRQYQHHTHEIQMDSQPESEYADRFYALSITSVSEITEELRPLVDQLRRCNSQLRVSSDTNLVAVDEQHPGGQIVAFQSLAQATLDVITKVDTFVRLVETKRLIKFDITVHKYPRVTIIEVSTKESGTTKDYQIISFSNSLIDPPGGRRRRMTAEKTLDDWRYLR